MAQINIKTDDKIVEFYREIGSSPSNIATYLIEAFPALYKRTVVSIKRLFSEGELKLLLDVSNGLMLTSALSGGHLLAQVEDGIDLDGLDKKWGIKRKEIVEKIKSLSGPEIAIVELWARAFWKQEFCPDNYTIKEYIK